MNNSNNTVYAIHNFEAENDDEINFFIGEPVVVVERDEKYLDGWWQGRNVRGETGLFPMNYTSPEKPSVLSSSSSRSSGSTLEDEIDDALNRLQLSGRVEQWSTDQVAQWAKSTGLASVAQTLVDQEITGDILLDLDIEALKELGISTFGKRYKVMQAITCLKEQSGLPFKKRLHRNTPPLPPPEPSISTSSSSYRSPSRTSSHLRRSESILPEDELYQFPRKAPLPPSLKSDSKHDIVRPLSPQSLSSSGVSRSNTYTTMSSGASRKTKSRDQSPDPKSFLHQRLPSVDTATTPWLGHDSQQPMQIAHTHTLSVSSPLEEPSRASKEAFQAPEHEGWLHKQSDKYKTWNKRWFVLKGTNLFYFKSPKDVRMKGIVNLHGYKIIPDEMIHTGKYCFKAQHELERTFYFYTDSELQMRTWIKMLMKATIARDLGAPVMSSNQMATVSLDVARRMRPRPPSVLMYSKTNKENGSMMASLEESPEIAADEEQALQQAHESGITHPHEDLLLEEEEDLIDPQHRSLPPLERTGWDATEYVHWVNTYLPAGKHIMDLTRAFRNGETLIWLLEAISQKTVRRSPVQKGGSVSVMMLDNIVAAFKFMGKEGVDVDGCYTIKDVFGGNEERILTMLDSIRSWAEINYSHEQSWRGSAMLDGRSLVDSS
ncbi:hypothetical protein BY458DRAFT_515339 [Sporodiniella umbellata]|nr:hypothetical protein BY458DRAFT_515339 [Sporodiniella umbellata]